MLNPLKSIISFLKHPEERLEEVHKTTSKLKWFFGLIVLNLVLVYMASFIQRLPGVFGFVDFRQHSIVNLVSSSNIYVIILILCIIAPVIEELVFRLPLRFKKYNFIPFIVFGILLNGIGILYKQLNSLFWIFLIPVILSTIASVLIFNPILFRKISNYLRKKYGWYFYFITLFFAFYHLTNFQYSTKVLLFAPILVLPQIVAGFFLGYVRIKLGLYWGMLFHSAHNMLFFLPFYLVMNSVNHNHVSLSQINKDGYTIEFSEEGDSVFYYGSNVTPDEIKVGGTMKEVVSILKGRRKDDIKFENVILSEKKIGIHFKNDSAYDSPSTGIARQLTLDYILEKYNLVIESEKRWAGVYRMYIIHQNKFEKFLAKVDSTVIHSDYIRRFYGENDTIKLVNTNSNYLKGALELNFDVYVENAIDKNLIFSVNIPNGIVKETGNFLKENYGIGLEREQAERDFLIVKSK